MNIKKLSLISTAILTATFGAAQAQTTTTIVSDIFPVADASELTASYFGTSGSSAIDTDMTANIGLRSGSSGRQLHGLFDTVTLSEIGDSVTASITFLTPATTAVNTSDDMRIGLFDHLERTSATELGANISSSSSTPNPLLNGLPGLVVELDVDGVGQTSTDDETGVTSITTRNINLRQSAPTQSGRLLGTTGGGSIGNVSSSDDLGYQFTANTLYNVTFTIARVTGETEVDELGVTVDFSTVDATTGDLTAIGTLSDQVIPTGSTDTTGTVPSAEPSYSFGMLGFGASAGAFGSNNSNNAADNGLDFVSITVESATGGDVEPGPDPVDSEKFCFPVTTSAGGTAVICFDD